MADKDSLLTTLPAKSCHAHDATPRASPAIPDAAIEKVASDTDGSAPPVPYCATVRSSELMGSAHGLGVDDAAVCTSSVFGEFAGSRTSERIAAASGDPVTCSAARPSNLYVGLE